MHKVSIGRLARLAGTGLSCREISDRLGVSRCVVRRLARRFGIRIRGRPKLVPDRNSTERLEKMMRRLREVTGGHSS